MDSAGQVLAQLSCPHRIAEALMGPAGVGSAVVGLTPGLLLGYGVFFLLGFALFAVVAAAQEQRPGYGPNVTTAVAKKIAAGVVAEWPPASEASPPLA